MRTALICCTIINAVLRPKKLVEPKDFLESQDTDTTQEMEIEDMALQLKAINAAFGGTEGAV